MSERFWKIVSRFCTGILLVTSFLMFYLAYSSYQANQEFLNSERVKTIAVIKENDGVKTYNYSANEYGVVGKDPDIKDIGKVGEKVTIYYQKDKSYVVYRSQNPRNIWQNVWTGIFWGVAFLLIVITLQVLLPWLVKRYKR